MQELAKDKADPDPKALACYGMLVAESGSMPLRFVDGRLVSAVTTAFLEWLCEQVAASGKQGLVLIWDNASWHVSSKSKPGCVNTIRRYSNKLARAKLGCALSHAGSLSEAPGLTVLWPKWVHGKRVIVEPARLLTALELMQRVYDYFGCKQLEPLTQQVS